MGRRKKQEMLDIEPNDPSGWQILVKGFVGLIIGTAIAFLIFVMLILVNGIIQSALVGTEGTTTGNPLLPIILMVIAFIGTFVGNLILAGVLNLVYTAKYYDMGKMFSISLLLNVLLFIFFMPLYFIYTNSVSSLFLILGMHILLTVFICYAGIEISTNPNYAGSHLVGATRGFAVAVFMFAIFFKFLDTSGGGNQVSILLSLPPVVGYLFIPLFHTIWEKLYYKFYSLGNNFLYIPSLNEVMVDAEDDAEINVDI